MILVTGVKHSFTSAVMQFIYHNYPDVCGSFDHNPTDLLPYEKYEHLELRRWYESAVKGNVKKFPYKLLGVYKLAEVWRVLEHVPDYIRILFVMRDPMTLIKSHQVKYDRSATRILNTISQAYQKAVSCPNEVFFFPAEAALNKDDIACEALFEWMFPGYATRNIKYPDFKPVALRSDLKFKLSDRIIKYLT